jgi:hypothetical protein
VWLKVVPKSKKVGAEMHPVWRVLATLFTLHLVAFGWLLFASAQQKPEFGEDLTLCLDMLNRIAYNFHIEDIIPTIEASWVALTIMCIGYAMHYLPKRFSSSIQNVVTRSGFVGQWLIVVAVIWIVMQCSAMLVAETGVAAGLPMYADY